MPGVVAFSETLRGCEAELQSVLEVWILLGLKLGHDLPVMEGMDLNREPTVAATEAL
jgi:predicted RNase H-like HicB family nuclease